MKHEMAQVLRSSVAHAIIPIGDVRWKLYVFGVSRVSRDTFVQIALVGPRICTVTVRARGPIGNRLTARRVLAVVREWLLSDDQNDRAYLELPDLKEVAS